MICAISAAPSAIPPNPKIAAIIAIIKKITIKRIITVGLVVSDSKLHFGPSLNKRLLDL
jgi:hypothetical protein